jgi:hypothetical protein
VRLFRRRRGRHELGAAVRELPVGALGWPAVAAFQAGPEALPTPRVELGFRDGTTAELAPDSPPARALLAVAQVLVRRD